jgi:hypothetical protein
VGLANLGFDLTYADVASRGATQVAYFLLKPDGSTGAMLGLEHELADGLLSASAVSSPNGAVT